MKAKYLAWLCLLIGCQAHPQAATNPLSSTTGQNNGAGQSTLAVSPYGTVTFAVKWPKYYRTNAIPSDALSFCLRLSDASGSPVPGFPAYINRPDNYQAGIQVIKSARVAPGTYWVGANVYDIRNPLPSTRPILFGSDATLSVRPNERAAAWLQLPEISRPTSAGPVTISEGDIEIVQDITVPRSNNQGGATLSYEIPNGDDGTIGITFELPPTNKGGVAQ